MGRLPRIAAVTAGLVVAGACFGAVAGVLALTVVYLASGHLPFGIALQYAAFVGALFGAAGAPPVAWLLLRRVPLGLAVAWSVVGTAAGGAAGWGLGWALRSTLLPAWGAGKDLELAVVGAAIGFVVTAVVLRLRHRGGRRAGIAT